MAASRIDHAGRIEVWGGGLTEVNFCTVDSHGNFDSGPEVPGQDEIEEQIRAGYDDGETDAGTSWKYTEQYAHEDDDLEAGWIACDYTQGDRLDDVRHATEIRSTPARANYDQDKGGYDGVRYVHTDGYLYVEQPD